MPKSFSLTLMGYTLVIEQAEKEEIHFEEVDSRNYGSWEDEVLDLTSFDQIEDHPSQLPNIECLNASY